MTIPVNVVATISDARVAYASKEYERALLLFKGCLRLRGAKNSADLRLAIGYCLVKLGHLPKARVAFQRALELEPNKVGTLVALALLDINYNAVERGVQHLATAYRIDPKNPMLVNHLANHYFCREELDKCEQLAWYSFNISDNERTRAESCFHLARCFHKKCDYQKAFNFYRRATQFDHPGFVLPHFGLGQMHIQRGEFEKAENEFDAVLGMRPNCAEAKELIDVIHKSKQEVQTGGKEEQVVTQSIDPKS